MLEIINMRMAMRFLYRPFADKIRDLSQFNTHHAYMRPLCDVSILFIVNEEFGSQLYKIDPAGHYMRNLKNVPYLNFSS